MVQCHKLRNTFKRGFSRPAAGSNNHSSKICDHSRLVIVEFTYFCGHDSTVVLEVDV